MNFKIFFTSNLSLSLDTVPEFFFVQLVQLKYDDKLVSTVNVAFRLHHSDYRFHRRDNPRRTARQQVREVVVPSPT